MADISTVDKHAVLSLCGEPNSGARPLSEEWLQNGIELLLQGHEASTRLVELDALIRSANTADAEVAGRSWPSDTANDANQPGGE